MDSNRNADGTLKKGHSLNVGATYDNTKRKQVFAALEKAVTLKDVRTIVKKAVTQAIDGDAAARKFIFEYLLGKPVALVEVDATLKTPGIDQWWAEALGRLEDE